MASPGYLSGSRAGVLWRSVLLWLLALVMSACLAPADAGLGAEAVVDKNGWATVEQPEDNPSNELVLSLALDPETLTQYRDSADEQALAFMEWKPTNGAGAATVVNHVKEPLDALTDQDQFERAFVPLGSGDSSWAFLLPGLPTGMEGLKSVVAKEIAGTTVSEPLKRTLMQNVRFVVTRAVQSGAKAVQVIGRAAASTGRAAGQVVGTVVRTSTAALEGASLTSVGTFVAGAANIVVISVAFYRILTAFHCDTFWHWLAADVLSMMSIITVDCYEEAARYWEGRTWSAPLVEEFPGLARTLGLIAEGEVVAKIWSKPKEQPTPRKYPEPPRTYVDEGQCTIVLQPPYADLGGVLDAYQRFPGVYSATARLERQVGRSAGLSSAQFTAGSILTRTVTDPVLITTPDPNLAKLSKALAHVASKKSAVLACPGVNYLVVIDGSPLNEGHVATMLQEQGFAPYAPTSAGGGAYYTYARGY